MRTRAYFIGLAGGLACLVGLSCQDPPPPPSEAAPSTTASVSAHAPSASTSAASAAAKKQAAKPFNVLMLMVDSLRADRMPWAKYPHDVAPVISGFAKTAVNYTRFHSVSSFTSQTFGGLLAARYPSEIPRSGYFFSSYPDEVLMFPELLQKAGVRTMSAQAHWYFRKDKGRLHQGFDEWEITPGLKKSNTTDQNVTSPKLLKIALRHLSDKKNTAGPFFALYHFLDPHDQYVGHAGVPKMGRGARGAYNGEIYFTDKHIGKLLDFVDAQPWGKNTAVIITSDHGETFGEHGMYRHGFELWQELIHVPLLIRVPGYEAKTIDVPRGGIDLPRTIMALLGVAPDENFQGHSLLPEMRGDAPPAHRPVISDLSRTSDNDRRRAMIWKNYKIIAYGDDNSFKLFDLEADPKEKRDLATTNKKLFKEMRKRYEDTSKTIKDRCPKMRNKLRGKKRGRPC